MYYKLGLYRTKRKVILVLCLLLIFNYQRVIAILVPNVLINLNVEATNIKFGTAYDDISEDIRHQLNRETTFEDANAYHDPLNECDYLFSNFKLAGIQTYNPSHNFFGVSVGDSYEKSIKKIEKSGFRLQEKNSSVARLTMFNLYIKLYKNSDSDTISEIYIHRTYFIFW